MSQDQPTLRDQLAEALRVECYTMADGDVMASPDEILNALLPLIEGAKDLRAEPHLSSLAADAEHVTDLRPGGTVSPGLGDDVAQGVLGLGNDVSAEPETVGGRLAAVGEVVGDSGEDCGAIGVHVVKHGLTLPFLSRQT